LLWQGHHRIEVRAREAATPESLDPTPSVLPFIIDTVPPVVSVARAGDHLEIRAHDIVSHEDTLQYAYAPHGNDFMPLAGPTLPLGQAGDLSALVVRDTDEAGNQGFARLDGAGATDSGCSVAGHSSQSLPLGSWLVLLFLAASTLGLRRVRLRRI